MEAYEKDQECPLCGLEEGLERRYVQYFLGGALMDPDTRKETNKEGFCRDHASLLYNSRENVLGLALMIDTWLQQHNAGMDELYDDFIKNSNEAEPSRFFKWLASLIRPVTRISDKIAKKEEDANDRNTRHNDKNHIKNYNEDQNKNNNKTPYFPLIDQIEKIQKGCAICDRIENFMKKYLDVIFYLWENEETFRKLASTKKGYCLNHFKLLLSNSEKYLGKYNARIFNCTLVKMQKENMNRIRNELNWFTKKFDYKNNDTPWGNSKDSLPRALQKIVGLKR